MDNEICGRFLYQKIGKDRYAVTFYSHQAKMAVFVRDHINTYEEASQLSDEANRLFRLSKYSDDEFVFED